MSPSHTIEELAHLQEWLKQSFGEAAKGLPWPQQLALLVAEQALVTGLCATLLVRSAGLRLHPHSHARSDELADVAAWLEQSSFRPLIERLPSLLELIVSDWANHPTLFKDILAIPPFIVVWLKGLMREYKASP